MSRPPFEVADVIHEFLPSFNQQRLPVHHRRTLKALQQCRTAALGGHIDACDHCDYLRISYNSCRNRHCPKHVLSVAEGCQGINKEMWSIQQEDMLLPIAYFHVVFTLPHQLNGLCLYNQKLMYDLLFKAAWHTINTLANDPKWLGAKTAATMVLHTWSQTLVLHPHVHCIVPNGGLTQQGNWQFPKKGNGNFLFPVVAMRKIFKGFFIQHLKTAIDKGCLQLPPHFPHGFAYQQWKDHLYQKKWVVFTKKPFSGAQQVVNYLARYSHRVALTNHRIKNIENGKVVFQYKDYKDGAKKKVMSLQGVDFLKRFCLHILPKGFRKVRSFGFLANASKAKSLDLARLALGFKIKKLLNKKERKDLALIRLFGQQQLLCPCCKKGKLSPSFSWNNKDPPTLAPPIKKHHSKL